MTRGVQRCRSKTLGRNHLLRVGNKVGGMGGRGSIGHVTIDGVLWARGEWSENAPGVVHRR